MFGLLVNANLAPILDLLFCFVAFLQVNNIKINYLWSKGWGRID